MSKQRVKQVEEIPTSEELSIEVDYRPSSLVLWFLQGAVYQMYVMNQFLNTDFCHKY